MRSLLTSGKISDSVLLTGGDPMLTKERFFRILELLDHKSFITIQELMEVLNASKSTFNRDLIEL